MKGEILLSVSTWTLRRCLHHTNNSSKNLPISINAFPGLSKFFDRLEFYENLRVNIQVSLTFHVTNACWSQSHVWTACVRLTWRIGVSFNVCLSVIFFMIQFQLPSYDLQPSISLTSPMQYMLKVVWLLALPFLKLWKSTDSWVRRDATQNSLEGIVGELCFTAAQQCWGAVIGIAMHPQRYPCSTSQRLTLSPHVTNGTSVIM